MNISVVRDNIEIGEWTEQEVREFYREGRLVDTDRYWTEGMTDWLPLSGLIRPPPDFPGMSHPTPSPENMAERPTLVAPIDEPAFSSVPLTPVEVRLKAGFNTRIAARTIDMALITVPALIFSIPVFVLFGYGDEIDLAAYGLSMTRFGLSIIGQIIAWGAAFLLWDVVWIGTTGTSPGKFIFGLKVVRENGEQMYMGIAWRRVLRLFKCLWFLFGFPEVTFGLAIYQQYRFKRIGTTSWDQLAGTVVTAKRIGVVQKVFGAGLFISSVIFWLFILSLNYPYRVNIKTPASEVAAPISAPVTVAPQAATENPPLPTPSTQERMTPSAPPIVAPAPAPEPSPPVVTVATDNEEAAGYRIKATAGDVVAASKLGRLYYLGLGVPRDYAEALKWLQVAADHDDAYGQDKVGEMYRDGHALTKDYSQAVAWFQKSADQGFADAQSNMGDMYKSGRGVAKDEAKAQKWFETALPGLQKDADQGDVEAQYDLGDMYSQGDGVTNDDSQAFGWYQKAANQGYAGAQADIGAMYDEGKGVAQDYGQALGWFQKAAAQGNMYAQDNIGFMYFKGNGVAQDYGQALLWYQKAADQGYDVAENSLGNMYSDGHGVDQDYSQALIWYQKAADQGNMYAQFSIGLMYDNGHGVAQDYGQALSWFLKAANQGNASAQFTIGFMYASGKGVAQDYDQAFTWNQKAANQGNANAQYANGYMYENGYGVAQDPAIAVEWYRKAAAQGQPDAQAALKRLGQ